MIKLTNATPEDIPLIIDLAEKTWWPTYSSILEPRQIRYMLDAVYSPEALKNVMEKGGQQFIILSDERGPQGFASYGLRSEDPSICKLHKIYVLPQNQGKGYGKLLVQEIKDRMLNENINVLDLNVNRYNNARYFYEKLGFVILKEEDVAIGPYWMNDYVMRLEFTGKI